MKKGNFFANCVFAVSFLFVTLAFTACSADSSDDADAIVSKAIESTKLPFSVVLKAFNSEGNDITTKGDVDKVTLFVFDQHNNFVKQLNVSKSAVLNRSTIEIDCPEADQLTVIAWSGVSAENEEISSMSQANTISDLQVRLNSTNGVATHPSDLFYGQVTINRSNTKANAANELAIARKTAVFNLTTKGLGETKGEYVYKIKNTRNSLNHLGEIAGEEVEYIIPTTFDQKGNVVAKTQTILPASQVTIELYKDGNLVFSSEKDKNGEIFSAAAGKQSDIIFNCANNNSASVMVIDWAVIIQHVTIN